MLKPATSEKMFSRISDSTTHDTGYYAEEPPVGTANRKQGTSHLSVLAANGDAVAVTSTINTL